MDKQSLEIRLKADCSLITEPLSCPMAFEVSRMGCWLTDTESGKIRWIDRTEIDFVRPVPASTISRLQLCVPAS